MSVHWGGRGPGHVSRRTKKVGGSLPPYAITPPSIAGTLTDGSTITCTPGVWSSGTATRQWYRDGSPISGQTGLTYTYSAATDDGRYLSCVETNGAVISSSNVLIAGLNTLTYSTGFDAPDGTLLNGWDGWSISDNTHYEIFNNNLRQKVNGTDGETGTKLLRAGPGVDHEIEVTLDFSVDTNADTSSIRYLYVRHTDANNWACWQIQNNGFTVIRRAGGSSTTIQSYTSFSPNLATGDVVKIRVAGNYMRLFRNGVELPASAAANSGQGYDISAAGSGTQVGMKGSPGSGTAGVPFKLFSAAAVYSIPANEITFSTSAIEDVPGIFGSQRIRLTGGISGSVSQLQALVLSASGQVLLDWANVSGLSGSAFDSVTATLPSTAQGQNVTVWLRDATNKNTAKSVVKAVPVAAEQVNMTHGMNATAGNYTSDNLMDVAILYCKRQGSYREVWTSDTTDIVDSATSPSYAASSDLGMDSNNFPTQFPNAVSGYNASPTVDYPFYIMPFVSGVPAGLTGTYDVTFTPGLRWDLSGAGSTVSRSNYNEAAGTATLTIVQATGANPEIIFRGYDNGGGYVAGTMPPAGTGYFRAIKQGADGKLFHSGSKTSLSALISKNANRGYARWMTDLAINRQALTGVTYGERTRRRSGAQSGRVSNREGVSYEKMLEFAVESDTNVWLNIPDNASPAYIIAAAAFWRDNLPSGRKLALEDSNERWNFGGGFMQSSSLLYSVPNFTGGNLALSDGDYVKGATSGKIRKVGKQVVQSGTIGGGNASGYLILRTGETNGLTSGESLHKCDAAGSVITSNIAVVSATDSGQHVRHARRSAWMFDIFAAEFGVGDPRLEPVIAWQSSINATILAEMLNTENLWQRVKKVAIAPYIGGGIGTGGDLGNYNVQQIFTQAQRDAVVSSGKAQFKTNAFAAQATMSGLSKAVWMNFVTMLAQYAVSKGLSKTAIRPATYEHNWQHILEANTPTGSSQKVLTNEAFAEMIRDARAGDAQDAMNDWMKETGGDFVAFEDVSAVGTTLASFGNWGYRETASSTTDEPYASTVAWIAANL